MKNRRLESHSNEADGIGFGKLGGTTVCVRPGQYRLRLQYLPHVNRCRLPARPQKVHYNKGR